MGGGGQGLRQRKRRTGTEIGGGRGQGLRQAEERNETEGGAGGQGQETGGAGG